MAKITVEGSVGRLFYENKGVEVIEFYKSRTGEKKSRKYTAWFENPQNLTVGQTGTFSGSLSAEIDDWKNQDGSPKLDQSGKPGRSIKLAINGATFDPDSVAVANFAQSALNDNEYPF